ncbi:Vsp/OspC family lipoprotein [Borreliella valaisiana]|uniref:Outer surface protein C (OspC) n=6 Tax=Borreliella TaxID=64895 RepID=C0R831_BORVA|nr:Vsp/OspC family lipoprotein [Borreliella valaisiana]AAD16111.1 outer surface protein C precursor [Borreliella valaisiana VS116]AAD16115.1 outer surface protein C precursor [Borreliella valaisiana]AAD16118.1 outer surface protein C precursor [Borreliella valaisiana]ACN52606.1 outer surface protein C (OspC) [Borreliella valaisiana VS116]
MKKNTLSAILMTLFLFISCNNSGGDTASTNPVDESAKGPNLTEISKKITDSNAIVLAVKEVETLLASINEIANKGIGKKINQNGLDNLTDHNGSLIAGAYVISTLITEKLNNLKNSEGLKEKIKKVKECSDKFTKKLTTSNGDLGKENVTDAHAQAAILKTNPTNDKGAKELGELFESVEILSKAAQEALTNSIAELTSPVVAENPKNP